ncbi:PD-(D/E)XK motif protein [uncultured Microbacterium sp.]|uniref:PD-(D/E)XK motif protein n=1 Tax=uncultured Microbacterium sp. TaxID=191216 RepID=UPI00263832B8|nr:PD-(D/E)XK motif protein [uncultured Microbacterium sp.]
MEIDPGHETIELTTPASGSDPEVTSFEHLAFTRFRAEGQEWFRLTVNATDMHYEAYVLVASVADQLRAGTSFRHAVSEAVFTLKDLLASRRRLTEEKELGLIGELLVLSHVLVAEGEAAAMAAWLGPLAEEHDFAFAEFDAEIKTTKSESRTHLIGSDTQLEASPGRPLYLVSIQLTRAGNANQGFGLPTLVDDIRNRLDQTLRTFDSALEGLGWHNADKDLYRSRFMHRNAPRAFFVDDEFPAITSSRLDQVVPNRPYVSGVTYRVNVADLAHAAISSPLHDFCEVPE